MSEEQGASNGDTTPKHRLSRQREIMILVGGLVAVGVLAVGLYVLWNYDRDHPSTDDAYLNAHYVWISPQVTGQVAELHVEPNQFVKAGDPLFKIDPRPFRESLTQAEKQLVLVRHQVEADKAQVRSAKAQVSEREAELKTAKEYADRFRVMVKSGAAAELDTIHYINALAEAKGKLIEAKAAFDEATVNLGEEEVQLARIATAEAQVELMRIDLGWTDVSAPADGYVTQFELRVGDVVQPADKLFPFIESKTWWVQANFKETEVGLVEPGMPATVTVDIYGSKKFKGVVESISRGAAASFSLLPPQNTTGNWVKVTQRIPVRIRMLEKAPKYPFRMGASVTASVDIIGPKEKIPTTQ